MVNPIIIGGAFETLSLALQLYMKLLEQSGMTLEQQEEFEALERKKFEQNRPANLPTPPPADEEETHS